MRKMRLLGAAFAGSVGLLTATAVHATCIRLPGGGATCCSGPGECYTVGSDEEPAYAAVPRGRAFVLGVAAHGDHAASLSAGGELTIGLRILRRPSEETLGGTRSGQGALCAPILCGFFGVASVPSSALVGDEIGVDLRARAQQGEGEATFDIALRPIARASPSGRLRTASLVGALLPELGIRLGEATRMTIVWHPYPVEYLIGTRSRLILDLGVGVSAALGDGEQATGRIVRGSLGYAYVF